MIDMPNRPNVAMRLVAVEFLFGHSALFSVCASLGAARLVTVEAG
jgi:hypothetical protein